MRNYLSFGLSALLLNTLNFQSWSKCFDRRNWSPLHPSYELIWLENLVANTMSPPTIHPTLIWYQSGRLPRLKLVSSYCHRLLRGSCGFKDSKQIFHKKSGHLHRFRFFSRVAPPKTKKNTWLHIRYPNQEIWFPIQQTRHSNRTRGTRFCCQILRLRSCAHVEGVALLPQTIRPTRSNYGVK